MTDAQVITSKNGGALAQWGSRDEVREVVTRLRSMLPGGDKLNDGQIKALAQAAIAHGLDPLNGELWIIPGRGLMIGVKGLRKKAHEQVKGNYWPEFFEVTDPEQRRRFRIPDGALAFECRLFDSENLRTYAESCERLLKAGIPWEAVRGMVGDKPYTPGYGVLKAGEQTKMEPVQCAMKRAEADALKRRFDVPFGLAVEADSEAPAAGEWVETTTTVIQETDEARETRQAGMSALYEEPAVTQAADEVVAETPATASGAVVERATEAQKAKPVVRAQVKNMTRVREWQAACKGLAGAYPRYQTEVKGKPSGQPNMFHILGAAAKCGYAEVNDNNFELVIEAIAARAKAE